MIVYHFREMSIHLYMENLLQNSGVFVSIDFIQTKERGCNFAAAGEMMKIERQNDRVIIYVSGKVDGTNAARFEAEAFEAIGNADTVVCDVEELSYISSAGLRVLLKIKKTVKDFLVVNVTSDIYEILDMTGFSQIMNVQRKRRQLSAEGCDEIARGAMGVIYRLDQDTILKVYDKSISLESLYQAQDVLKKLFIHDIPCAIPFDIVDVGDAHGCIYEMINMDTVAQHITKHPESAEECGRKTARLLKTLHQGELPKGLLPDAKDVLLSWLDESRAYITQEDAELCRNVITGFRDTANMLHLDFHTKNIMIRDDELMIIDLDDACIGDPMIDIGCMLMTMGDNHWSNDFCLRFVGITAEQKGRYIKAFFQTYFETEDDDEIAALLKPLEPISALRALIGRIHTSTQPPELQKAIIDGGVSMLHSALHQ